MSFLRRNMTKIHREISVRDRAGRYVSQGLS